MKKIYLVRHGESEGNAEGIHQEAAAHLSEKGKMQARIIGERCAKFPLDLIISSTMLRAKETTEIIAKKIDKKLDYSDLFVECRRPKEVIGKPMASGEVLKARKVIRENFHIPDFRFSDEENFEDLKERARNALKYLEEREEGYILVVTHGLFMKVLVALVLFEENLTPQEFLQLKSKLHIENTGITVLDFDQENTQLVWNLLIWNDHAHLS
ncbi:MAG: histidine phosphatase family protein [Patescibacteria group bacterium]